MRLGIRVARGLRVLDEAQELTANTSDGVGFPPSKCSSKSSVKATNLHMNVGHEIILHCPKTGSPLSSFVREYVSISVDFEDLTNKVVTAGVKVCSHWCTPIVSVPSSDFSVYRQDFFGSLSRVVFSVWVKTQLPFWKTADTEGFPEFRYLSKSSSNAFVLHEQPRP